MKRKTSLERLAPKDNKVLKVVIEAQEEEVKPPVSTPPLSARAARLAAIASGTYRSEEEDCVEDKSCYDTESETSESKEPTGMHKERKERMAGYQARESQLENGFSSDSSNTCILEQEGETYVFLGLAAGEDLVFVGQVYVASVFGTMEIGGARLSSGRVLPMATPEASVDVHFYPVFCPRSHALLRIGSSGPGQSVRPHAYPDAIDESLLEAVYEAMDISRLETLLVIKEMKQGMEGVHRVTGHYRQLLSLPTPPLIPGFYPVSGSHDGLRPLNTSQAWWEVSEQALLQAKRRERVPVSVVCGAKNQGKSTFARYLLHRLLSEYKTVAYLETDPGQTEFTPAGLISLHYLEQPVLGPSYTHQQLAPERSFFLGSTTARSHPDYYSECIRALVAHWRPFATQIPLVVNTQGWISGVGYALLLHHIQTVQPTDIFMMRHQHSNYKNLPESFAAKVMATLGSEVAKLHPVESYPASSQSVGGELDASRIRDLTMASYFHQRAIGNVKCNLAPRWDYSQHLVERVPWQVDWRTQLNAIWITYEEVKAEELLYALNGSVVGLLGSMATQENVEKEEKEGFTPPTYFNTTHRFPPQPEMTTCHGLAIVRAIDPSSHTLLLLTPLPAETLEKASAIVKGEIQLPSWALLDSVSGESSGVANIGWDHVPYIQNTSAEGVGSKVLKIRRNLLRRKQ
ncbi:Pre-mRNA cleavage complex II protein Clp1-domain-containing protein [Sporodiniella umbellata]|nr:Pre-mRNA cleavage complex II protein Clp1-domain-containing protein [Sporodiniella umbellata]